MEQVKKIRNTNRYYISSSGYCFKTKRLHEEIIPLRIIKGVPRVQIEDKKLNMVNLMIEHFIGDFDPDSKVSYKIFDNRIPLESIRIKKLKRHKGIKGDEILIFQYGCERKAVSANGRSSINTITSIDVLDSLKRTDFKCTYCGEKLNKDKWQLDHVHPISKGGLNVRENITPSCKECNAMKHSMHIDKLLLQCERILKNYKRLS